MRKEELVQVLGIVQARMSSSRLPGKVLMKIGPLTALEWTVERLLMANSVDEVIIATTTNKADRPILELCRQRGWPVHCGSEDDVLTRSYEAAGIYSPRIVVDVTSDCPFVDPRHIDILVAGMLRHGLDYSSNIVPRSWPDGLDIQVYKMKSFIRLAESDWAIREHTGWNFTQAPWPDLKCRQFKAPPSMDRPHWRLTLDTAEDMKVLRACWDQFIRFHAEEKMFPVAGLIWFLDKNKHLLTNSEVKSTTPGVV